ncbi:MAG TPA: PDZ domain-containing protein [Lacipirellulaceae bacterium]|jgi:hypothetical protein|nr:PDZ domain-containing protein [Lacipirellulaceae bacterium]
MSLYFSQTSVSMIAVVAFVLLPSIACAQDAQHAAAAKVAREKAAADDTAKASPVPKDSAPNNTTDKSAKGTLQSRAGEKVGNDPSGRSLILGMYVQETDRGHVKVVEVGAATPAFDAGIKRGDEVVSFDNFKADSYRKWIDGMQRMAAGAADGSMVNVVVMRDGNPVRTKIRIPEKHNDPVQLPIGLPIQGQQQPQQPEQGGIAQTAVAANNTAIESSGPFANFFSDQAGPATERAMAQLFRVGHAQPGARDAEVEQDNERVPAAVTDTAPNTRGARIGLAGFRNDPNGMIVMVDVGGLAPGNYNVGIGDPSLVGGQEHPSLNPSPRIQAPAGTTAPSPNSASPPQGSVQPNETRIPQSVLAQVGTARQQNVTLPANPAATSTDVPGQPSAAAATGQSSPNNALHDQPNHENAAKNTGALMANEIGTLTVDQSGTGRMQHVVEGMQVRNVVGQALVIYTSGTTPAVTLPPSLDTTVDPAGKTAGSAPPIQQHANGVTTSGEQKPVAAGIIRLISDRRPAPAGGSKVQGTNGSIAPPVGLAPGAQNPVR